SLCRFCRAATFGEGCACDPGHRTPGTGVAPSPANGVARHCSPAVALDAAHGLDFGGTHMSNRFTQALALGALLTFAFAAPVLANDTWIGTKAKIALLT